MQIRANTEPSPGTERFGGRCREQTAGT